MRRSTIGIVLIFFLGACNSLFYNRSFNQKDLLNYRSPLEKDGYTLVFRDEFNSGKLDSKIWKDHPYYGVRFHPDYKYMWYSPDNFSFTDSTIRLHAVKKEITADTLTFPYQVAYIENSPVMDQQYGFFEIRCKIPEEEFMWPAFWLASRHSWPPEIDIFEFYTTRNNSKQFSNLHKKNTNPKIKRANVWKEKGHKIPDPWKHFHTYGLEWTPKEIIWYVDGIKVRNEVNDTSQFKYPMHVIINLCIQNEKEVIQSTPDLNGVFEVDYVRVWKLNNP